MTFDTRDEAEKAIKLFNGTEFLEQKITVEVARRKSERQKTPGKYLGRSKRRYS